VPGFQRADAGGQQEDELFSLTLVLQVAQSAALAHDDAHAEERRQGDRCGVGLEDSADLVHDEDVNAPAIVQPRSYDVHHFLHLGQARRGDLHTVGEQPHPPQLKAEPQHQEREPDREQDEQDLACPTQSQENEDRARDHGTSGDQRDRES
jgi:hypothetical protein